MIIFSNGKTLSNSVIRKYREIETKLNHLKEKADKYIKKYFDSNK